MLRDENDNFLGPNPNAFSRRETESYLSVTWCEYFQGQDNQQLRCAIEAIRNSALNVKSKACFCVAETPVVLAEVAKTHPKARALYLPVADNDAHAGIYEIEPTDTLLLAKLADELWCDYYTKDSADELPMDACLKSSSVK